MCPSPREGCLGAFKTNFNHEWDIENEYAGRIKMRKGRPADGLFLLDRGDGRKSFGD
jgi:hypothetical protein